MSHTDTNKSFKVTKPVKVKLEQDRYFGQIGEIKKVGRDSMGVYYAVEFKNGEVLKYHCDHIELV